MIFFTKNFFVIYIFFTGYFASAMDLPTQQTKRPRSKSYPQTVREKQLLIQAEQEKQLRRHEFIEEEIRSLYDEANSFARIDAAIDRGFQNAQKEIDPMIQQLFAESDRRIAQILQPGSTPSAINLDQDTIPETFIDCLNLNIKKLTELHENLSSIPKEKIFALLSLNKQIKNKFLQNQETQVSQLWASVAQCNQIAEQFRREHEQHQTDMGKIQDEAEAKRVKNEKKFRLQLEREREEDKQEEIAQKKAEKKERKNLYITTGCIWGVIAVAVSSVLIWYTYFYAH